MEYQLELWSMLSTARAAGFEFNADHPSRRPESVWQDTRLIPTLVAGLSLTLFFAHGLFILLRRALNRPLDRPSTSVLEQNAAPSVAPFMARIQLAGGAEIVTWKLIRLVGTVALFGLSIGTLVRERSYNGHLNTLIKSNYPKKVNDFETVHEHDIVNISLVATHVYTSILALRAFASNARHARCASIHLETILLASWAVFFYRDIWPLGTYDRVPLDIPLDPLFWPKFTILTVIGVVTPLLIPTLYTPVDPENPSDEPAPEQTASLLSKMLFSFLDPLIYAGYRTTHLAYDLLPPLADYDRAAWLTQCAFKHLDPFITGKRRHVFWGFIRIFKQDFGLLFILIIVRTTASFLAPIAVNRLLAYIETSGDEAHVRPWVWIVLIAIGPLMGSIAIQAYNYISTRVLVRVESVMTELVFEHSLRIRLREETGRGTSNHTPTTSETATIVESEDESDGPNASATAAGSLPSIATIKNRVKGKKTPQQSQSRSIASTSTLAQKTGYSKESNLVGKINNLVTNDLNNITEARDFLYLAIYCPLSALLCTLFLYRLLGWSALVGLAMMVITLPVPGWMATKINTVTKERMKQTDVRIQHVTETMNILRMIKLFGWESKIRERLREKREEELVWLKRTRIWILISNNITYGIPEFTMLLTYATFAVVMGQPLSASIVFPSMVVFVQLREVVHIAFHFVPVTIQAKISLERLTDFLNDTELLDRFTQPNDPLINMSPPDIAPDVIGFNDAAFRWANAQPSSGASTPRSSIGSTSGHHSFHLRIDGTLTFKRDALNLVVAPTGSGKTSLLLALIGELHFEPEYPSSWYQLPREGGVAYAAQEAWVQNATIRDNIVFGASFDEERYKKVLHQCALERDLSLFDAGDKTEVGENGVTLSGGQKARITLARAIYSSADVILLDDVLSALDVHTAKWIVDKCFRGDLVTRRTIILVTHNVGLVSDLAQFMVSLSNDGRVVSRGSIADVLLKDKKLLAEVEKAKAENAAEEQIIDHKLDEVDAAPPAEMTSGRNTDGKLIIPEEIEEGHVSWSALSLYTNELGGLGFGALFVLGFLGASLIGILQTYFLGYWTRQYEGVTDPMDVPVYKYLGIYSGSIVLGTIVYSSAYALFVFRALDASLSIHNQLFDSIIGTTLRWLDTVPTSRVITRATTDLRSIDHPLPGLLSDLLDTGVSIICKLAAIAYMSPVFVFPGIAVTWIGWWMGQLYLATQLSVKREMSNARAPVLAHFNAGISGLTSIRAYGAEAAMKAESMRRIDKYTRAARSFYNLNRWISIRIDILSGLFAGALATYLIYGPHRPDAARTGFSLAMAVNFSEMILDFVRMLNMFEVEGNSLERIQQYLKIEQEPKSTVDGVPPAYWPASGELRVENLEAKYSEDGPLVLKDVNFTLKSGERIGVVGRTGSGKSSLTLSLLRGILTSGRVFYDGLDTGKLNLDALRGNITIIPQQPELLSGSLRLNLDPFEQHDDAYLNDALRASGLFKLQEESEEGRITLDTSIASGGNNLSLGQRQIIALARAIARRSKILILDEATAAVDYETDAVIQESIRRELRDVTLITVAHRLRTIMDADKIMVLDAGRLVEFDTPKELLMKKDGFFRSLVDESADKDQLIAMTGGHEGFGSS